VFLPINTYSQVHTILNWHWQFAYLKNNYNTSSNCKSSSAWLTLKRSRCITRLMAVVHSTRSTFYYVIVVETWRSLRRNATEVNFGWKLGPFIMARVNHSPAGNKKTTTALSIMLKMQKCRQPSQQPCNGVKTIQTITKLSCVYTVCIISIK